MTTEAPSVFIAMPAYQDVTPGAVASLFALQGAFARRGIECTLNLVTGCLLPQARNLCVRQFLASDRKFLLMIDADIAVNAADVLAMIDNDVDVVGLIGPKRDLVWEEIGMQARQPGVRDTNIQLRATRYCVRTLPDQDPFDTVAAIKQSTGGIIEVQAVGTGCLLIERDVFSDISQAGLAPVIQFREGRDGKPAPLAQYFTFGPDEAGVWQSEDFRFCAAWRSTGGKVFVRPNATVIHEGRYGYVGNLATALNVAVPP